MDKWTKVGKSPHSPKEVDTYATAVGAPFIQSQVVVELTHTYQVATSSQA